MQAVERPAPFLTASVELAAAPPTAAISYAPVGNTDVATIAEFLARPVPEAAVPEKPQPVVVATLTDPAEALPQDIPPAQAPAAITTDALPQVAATTTERIELVGECQVAETCIDQFLWALYQRTPKEDTVKERRTQESDDQEERQTGHCHQKFHQAGR